MSWLSALIRAFHINDHDASSMCQGVTIVETTPAAKPALTKRAQTASASYGPFSTGQSHRSEHLLEVFPVLRLEGHCANDLVTQRVSNLVVIRFVLQSMPQVGLSFISLGPHLLDLPSSYPSIEWRPSKTEWIDVAFNERRKGPRQLNRNRACLKPHRKNAQLADRLGAYSHAWILFATHRWTCRLPLAIRPCTWYA